MTQEEVKRDIKKRLVEINTLIQTDQVGEAFKKLAFLFIDLSVSIVATLPKGEREQFIVGLHLSTMADMMDAKEKLEKEKEVAAPLIIQMNAEYQS